MNSLHIKKHIKWTFLSALLAFSTVSHSNQCTKLLSVGLKVKSVQKLQVLLDEALDVEAVSRLIDATHSEVVLNRKLRVKPEFVRKVFQHSMVTKLEGLSLEHLIKVLSILQAGRNYHLSSNFVKAFEKAALNQQNGYSPQHLARVVNMFSKMQTIPSNDFLSKWEGFMVDSMSLFTQVDLTSVIFSYGSWGRMPQKSFLRYWKERVFTLKDSFEDQPISNITYALYLLKDREHLEYFLDVIPDESWRKIHDDRHIRQLSLVQLYLERVLQMQPEKLLRFRGEFERLVNIPKGKSTLEKAMERILKKKGVKFITQFVTSPGFIVDYFIEVKNKIIQVDGPRHYNIQYNGDETEYYLRPQDGLMDQVLRAYGYEVERWSHTRVNQELSDIEDHRGSRGFRNPYGLLK